jgi:hypothetical protein
VKDRPSIELEMYALEYLSWRLEEPLTKRGSRYLEWLDCESSSPQKVGGMCEEDTGVVQ